MSTPTPPIPPTPPDLRARRVRWRHWYVESVTTLALVVAGGGTLLLLTGHGPGVLLGAAPWVCAVLAVVSSTVVVPRRAALADVLWVAPAVAGAVAALASGAVPALVGATGVAALVAYQRVFTRQHQPAGPLAVGSPLPDVPLSRLDGSAVSTAQLRGTPLLLLFVRGSWCPFCVAQVRDLAAEYRELDRRGVRVIVVSPQRAEDTADLAARFEVPMDFLVDAGGEAMRALDLVQVGGMPALFSEAGETDTVVPTVVLVGADGTVRWLHHAADHRVRPGAPELVAAVDRMLGLDREGRDGAEAPG